MSDHKPAVRASESSPGWHSNAEVTGVMIGTPAYGGMVTTRYLTSALDTMELLLSTLRTEKGPIPIHWNLTEGDSLVQRARNSIAAKFMSSRYPMSHFVFIDSDLEWDARDVLKLIAHDVDVVCGIYPKKTEPVDFPFHPLVNEKGASPRNPITGAIQVAHAPTGFLCIKRDVFVKMSKAYPKLKYRLAEATEEENKWMYAFFDAYVEDGIMWSEDYGFCKRWREIGGEVWCDPSIRLGHVGSKIYRGSIGEQLDTPGTELICGWVVPKNDPWFGPRLRKTEGRLDQDVIEKALDYVENFGRAIDVGAHIGTWSVPLAEHFDLVEAIEPYKPSFDLLKENIVRCRNIYTHQIALWDKKQKLGIKEFGINSGEVGVVEGDDVWGVPLDELGFNDVGLIKIDVEGFEKQVLLGAEKTIKRCRPVIVIEEKDDVGPALWLQELGMEEVTRFPIDPLDPTFPVYNVIMVWSDD